MNISKKIINKYIFYNGFFCLFVIFVILMDSKIFSLFYEGKNNILDTLLFILYWIPFILFLLFVIFFRKKILNYNLFILIVYIIFNLLIIFLLNLYFWLLFNPIVDL